MPNTTLLLPIVFDLGGYIKIDKNLTGFTVSALKSTPLTLFVCRRTVSQSALLLVLDFHVPGQ